MSCEFSGCVKEARTCGLCSAHYEQKRQGFELKPLRVRGNHGECQFQGCPRKAVPGGLCRAHRMQSRSGAELKPVIDRTPAKGLTCTYSGCGRAVDFNSLCVGHAAQKRRGVELSELRNLTPSELTSQWMKDAAAAVSDRCIEWPFRYEQGNDVPARVTFEGTFSTPRWHVLKLVGKARPSEEHYALHSCDNSRCLNPAHLRWGTHAENMQDALDRERMVWLRHRGLVEWLDSQGVVFPDRFRPNEVTRN